MEQLNQLIKDTENEIVELYRLKAHAGIGTEGDFTIKISLKEAFLKELKARASEKEEGQKVFFICIITGINNIITATIGNSLFQLLNPPNHDDIDYKKWRPFVNETKTIDDMLQSLKSVNKDFKEYYLDENTTPEELDIIDQNINNSILIVDLLALNSNTEIIARRFNTRNVKKVITPIGRGLCRDIESSMENKRTKVFNVLEYIFSSNNISDFYHPDSPRWDNMKQALLHILGKNNREVKLIDNLNLSNTNQIRGLNSSL